MKKLLFLPILAAMLSSCVLLLEDGTTVQGQPSSGPGSTSVAVVPPPMGQVIYMCKGGRLALTYTDKQATVFYDGANRVLPLTKTSPKYTYTDGVYTWEAAGREGSISVRDKLADTCQY